MGEIKRDGDRLVRSIGSLNQVAVAVAAVTAPKLRPQNRRR